MRYVIPALTMANEFTDLDYVARYVDQLLATTGDRDYAIVFQWDGDEPKRRPDLVLIRDGSAWKKQTVRLQRNYMTWTHNYIFEDFPDDNAH